MTQPGEFATASKPATGVSRLARPLAPKWSSTAADALAPPHTDWLRHDLVITGPAADIATLRAAAAGAGAIPWHYPDLDLAEEDQVLALVTPPDGSRGLRVAAARVLARQLRAAVEAHQHQVRLAVGRSCRCPFDLHALLPVPDPLLGLGADDPASVAWLRAHWGTRQALRHVREHDVSPDRRQRHAARFQVEFWSADWTPWAAIRTLRARWPSLVFAIRPDYGDG